MEIQEKQIKKTATHTAIYAVGVVTRRLASLVMLPIYTRYLTPADYGVVELLSMAIDIATILIGLRISQAMFRYYVLAEKEEEKREVVSTVLLTIILTSCVGATLLYLFSEPLVQIIFGSSEYILEFKLFVFTLITNAIAEVGLSYLRAQQRPIFFVLVGIVSLFTQVSLNIYFVVIENMHVTGVVYSSLISGFMIATGLSAYVFYNVGFHYSFNFVKRLIKFVAPLVVASIGAVYVAYADKYFLRIYAGLADVGLYALASRISSVLNTVYEAFNMSWQADSYHIVKNENARQIYGQFFRYVSAAIIITGVGIALFANDLFAIMTTPEYYAAGYIVPILILSVIVRIYTMFCNFGAVYREKTGVIANASWIRVSIATAGYLLLIPYLGVYGAAISLALSNVVELIWVYTQSKKQYDMDLSWNPVFAMMFIAALIVGCGLLMPIGEISFFIYRILLFVVFLSLMYFSPVCGQEGRMLITEAYKKFFDYVSFKIR